MLLRPAHPLGIHPPIAKQHLAHTLPRPRQVITQMRPRPHQVAHRLHLHRRHPNHRQRPRHQQPHQPLRVAPIRLDPLTHRPRRLARRDHITTDPHTRARPRQPIPGRSRLITGMHRPRQTRQPRRHRLSLTTKPRPPKLTRLRAHHRRHHAPSVDIQPRPCHSPTHGRTLPSPGVSRGPSSARQTPDYANRVRPKNQPQPSTLIGSRPTGTGAHSRS